MLQSRGFTAESLGIDMGDVLRVNSIHGVLFLETTTSYFFIPYSFDGSSFYGEKRLSRLMNFKKDLWDVSRVLYVET